MQFVLRKSRFLIPFFFFLIGCIGIGLTAGIALKQAGAPVSAPPSATLETEHSSTAQSAKVDTVITVIETQ